MQYKIEQDTDIMDSPRDWDNLGIMVCWHRNYNLGDEQPKETLGVWLSGMMFENDLECMDQNGYYTEHWEDFIWDLENDDNDAIDKAWGLLDDKIFMLSLFIYDHSGITMNTTGFHCPWDSGQVGFIYVTKSDIRSEWGKQRISSKLRETVFNNLRAEVETYDQYLTGDVWGYTITDRHGDIVDSCWGFYGYDYCKQEAQSQMEYFQQQESAELIDLQSVVR